MDSTKVFDEHRGLLFSIAYRMLGSAADAEDMVQDAFLRWQEAPEQSVESPRAYLSTIVTRLCINQLQSARAVRETYIGPWLPEPLASEALGPDRMVSMADSLSMAFLVLLETLSPVERAVFLLREVFDYEFVEIARIVEKSEANCRQILRRARKQLGHKRVRRHKNEQQKERLVQQFVQATLNGNMEDLLSLLAKDIILYSDGGGKVAAALNPIYGADKVTRFLIGIRNKGNLAFSGVRIARVNGEPAILTYVHGRLNSVTFCEVENDRIQKLFSISNPDKLRRLS